MPPLYLPHDLQVVQAVTARKTLGQRIEDATREKIEREKEEGNITRADC